MVEIANKERTISKGLSKHAVIHMVKEIQTLQDGKWVTDKTEEADMDRDEFELMVGTSVVNWFNSVFGDDTFKVERTRDKDGKLVIEAVNTCPSGTFRNHETYTIVSD